MSLHGATSRMTVREFQRLTRRDGRRSVQRDLYARLLGEDGLVKPELCFERACPHCGASDPQPVFVAGGVQYSNCGACNLLYVARPVGAEGRALLEADPEVKIPFYTSDLQRGFDRPKFLHGAALLARHSCGAPRVLDVGTASGLFLEILAEVGCEHLGIDLREQHYGAWHAERGLNVRYGAFEELDLEPGRYNAITFWDCLEHMIDPGRSLERCHALLPPGGLCLILVPNAGSLAARVMRERCAMFDGVEHINLFSPQTLRAFAEARGFEELHLETIIPEVNVLNNYLDYEDPYSGPSDEIERVLGLDGLGQDFVLEHDLGYKILALFRRGDD